MTRKVIIDTDPGQDDAVALMLALASPELEVMAVVTVAGNVPLPLTTLNARRILELTGRTDVPLYAGCSRPMHRALHTAEHVHGPTGLDGFEFTEPRLVPRPQHGVDYLAETLLAAEPGSITVCTLGPLTNLAMALVKAPEAARGIRELVMMGGAYFEVGNITPAAEFNIYVDPEAAKLVLGSGFPVTMAPLDVTHRVLNTPERLARMGALGNRCGRAAAGMLGFSQRFDLEKYGNEGAPLHDPCVFAWLLKPELFSGRTVNVSVETTGELTTGMTVTDWWRITDRPKNAHYLRDVDAAGLYELLFERLALLP